MVRGSDDGHSMDAEGARTKQALVLYVVLGLTMRKISVNSADVQLIAMHAERHPSSSLISPPGASLQVFSPKAAEIIAQTRIACRTVFRAKVVILRWLPGGRSG